MMKAKIIKHSKSALSDDEIITYVLTFPRYILAELNTHRAFSKNSASSRAIPFKKMVKMVQENPFVPVAWQKDHKGMQGTEYFTDEENVETCINEWLKARDYAVEQATKLNEDLGYGGVTKQLCNRLLEPFMWHTVILTGTEFENFFAQRCPRYIWDGQVFRSKKDCLKYVNEHSPVHSRMNNWDDIEWFKINQGQADIHMMLLAEAMWDSKNESTPEILQVGEWHIPFGDKMNEDVLYNEFIQGIGGTPEDFKNAIVDLKLKIATARCARVSYNTFDGEINYEADLVLFDKLVNSDPPHWSPTEHIAQVMSKKAYEYTEGRCRNFKGFIQYRAHLENDNFFNADCLNKIIDELF